MHIFNYSFLKTDAVPPYIVNLVSRLEGFSERSKLLMHGRGKELSDMQIFATAMSMRDSNAIEGIRTTDDRIFSLLSERAVPKNHSEKEIIGYRDALRHILANYGTMDVDREGLLELYAILTRYSGYRDEGFKTTDNVIVDRAADGSVENIHRTVPHDQVEECLAQLYYSLTEARCNPEINVLLLIPCFVMDFLRIHPFLDGNGRMSRLLTTMLLCREGYDVCRYVSMETKINTSKGEYYRALEESEEGWFDSTCDYFPFIDYFLGRLFLCYRDFDRRLAALSGKTNKGERIRYAVLNSAIPISKKDLSEMFPDISVKTIELTLQGLVRSREVVKTGSTRNARYSKNPNSAREAHSEEGSAHLDSW